MIPQGSVFVTGTDTGVGKTFITAEWTRRLRAAGVQASALKPIACGDRADAEVFAQVNGESLTLNQINPVFYQLPAAPLTAAMLEDRPIDWEAVRQAIEPSRRPHPGPLLIEGVGGWRVPLDPGFSVREWAAGLGLPVVVVARLGLGTLNHTLLTLDNIRLAGLSVHAVILNPYQCPDDLVARTNPAILAEWGACRVYVFPDLPDLPGLSDSIIQG